MQIVQLKLVSSILFFILLSSAGNMYAQTLPMKKYTAENGLASNQIRRIIQDHRGFLWIITGNGLSKFDGFRFSNYDEDQNVFNVVNDVWEDEKGNLLIAQNNGAVTEINNGIARQLIPPNKILINHFIKYKNNRVLLATDNAGIAEWENDRMILINPADTENISDLLPFNDSLLLALNGTLNGMYYISRLLTKDLQLFSVKEPGDILSYFRDSNGRSWLGCINGLRILSPIQGKGSSLRYDSLPPAFNIPALKKSAIFSIFEDSQKNMWFGTDNGLVIVDTAGSARYINTSNGLPYNIVSCIMEDREQNIWLGTMLGLVKIPTLNDARIYGLENGLSSDYNSLVLPLDSKKIKIFNGIIQELDLSTGKIINSPEKKKESSPVFISLNDSRVLEINKSGCIMHTKAEKQPIHLKLPLGFKPDYGIEVRKGLFLLAGESNTIIVADSSGFTSNAMEITGKIMALGKDNHGAIWAGAWESGLYKLTVTNNRSITILDTLISRLPDTHIRSLLIAKDGSIWAGTRYKGIVRIIPGPNNYQLQNIQQKDGLVSNWTRCIAEDANHNIWAGSLDGVDKLIPGKQNYRVFNFGRINNLNTSINSIIFMNDESLVCAGFPSIIHIRDNHLDTLSPFPVYITGKRTANNSTDFSTISYTQTKTLPYDSAQIGFEFSSPRFFNEKQIQYSYRLLGSSDTNWSRPTLSHNVFYASLQSGNYRFQVRTIGWNNQPGTPASYSFIVATPYWKTPWFFLLAIVVSLAIIYAIYRNRLKQIMKIQKMRNAIARDLHDDIGSSLTNINILSSLIRQHIGTPQQANEFLNRISEESSHSSQALDDIIWNVNTDNDNMEKIVARMRRYAAELFDATNVNYELTMDTAIAMEKISMEQRRDMYLVFKESLNNICKHANASNVRIGINIRNHCIILDIRDDGKGFDTTKESVRNGIRNLKNRIAAHKGELNIESGSNSGTSIIASIPLS